MLLFTGAFVGSRDVYNTVGINIEGNLNLRDTAACGSDAIQMELA